ncbi:hypothetical protein EII22_07410 [Coriobacteriales bacterium OH1046]|nr:hypothetical protein EII22_07410 [Coriobacteriales bacterium OH1046]
MRILAIADKEDAVLCSRIANGAQRSPDLIVSCGDLRPGYLDFVATAANAPLLYVRGNHDTDERGYASMGGTALGGCIVTVKGIRIAGLDGSLDYRMGIVGFSEAQMRRKALMLAMHARLTGGLDVLVTHAPPLGYGDLDDRAHRGFACFNWLLDTLRPKILLHGHTHLDYGLVARELAHPSGTRIVNACGHWEGEL